MNRREWVELVAAGGLALGSGRALGAGRGGQAEAGRSILLFSGWATHNIGDIGHTPGTLRYFTEFLPEVRVTCWIRRTNPAVTAMLQRRFPNVQLVEGSLSNQGQASTPELQAAFDGADLFVQNSGMHFARFWAPPVGFIQACQARGKPFGLYGQSFDGFRDQDKAALPDLLSAAAFIFCRDTESLLFLRSVGVRPPILEFGPDGCFGIDVRDDARAEAFLAAHGLKPREFLSVTLRTDKEVSKNAGPDPITGSMGADPEVWYQKLRDVIIAWVERTGQPVVLLPEVEKEIASARRELFDKLPEAIRARVVHRDTFWNADEAVSVYARARALVSMEPHSCIMALANGTPAIHYFSRQHGFKAWMFRDIGLAEWLLDIDRDPAARVTAALDRITALPDLTRAKLDRAMTGVHARSREMAGDIARVLGPAG